MKIILRAMLRFAEVSLALSSPNVRADKDRRLNSISQQNAVLCADCDVVSDSPHDQCLVCGSRSLFNVSRLLGGMLPSQRAIGCVYSDYFALRIEDGAAAAAVGGGGVVGKFVADHISQVSAGRGWPNQGKRGQFAGGALVIAAIGETVVDGGR
jgi:hypothetical protein